MWCLSVGIIVSLVLSVETMSRWYGTTLSQDLIIGLIVFFCGQLVTYSNGTTSGLRCHMNKHPRVDVKLKAEEKE